MSLEATQFSVYIVEHMKLIAEEEEDDGVVVMQWPACRLGGVEFDFTEGRN